ncbi:response regulator transcription factor [Pseudonocardia hispaniensis]|uniref:Response regulator transcription factor n=1 Tax=Pseudonocardia hispaniensis TaxID=904933 RepID=A0ABW1J698_9PSEU
MTRTGQRARCWRDIGVDYARTPSAVQVFRPAGYAGGATARLTTRDGRYTGDLHLSTTDPELPVPAMMAALHHLAPVLASVTDVTRRISLLLDDLERDAAAAVVSDQADVVPLPGRNVPAPLEKDPDVVRRVMTWRGRPDTVTEARFLHRMDGRWHRARLVKIAGGTLVVLRETPPPYGLTARELQVLTLLCAGLLNVAIAHRLGIRERTAAHHVEHVLAKLGAASRTAAARRAVEEGLRLLP